MYCSYLELTNWDLEMAIEAAKEDVEWEKPQYTFDEDQLVYASMDACDKDTSARVKTAVLQRNSNDCVANLLKYKRLKESEEKWEEMSYGNGSYSSCVNMIETEIRDADMEEGLPFVVAFANEVKNAFSGRKNMKSQQFSPDFGIELQEITSSCT